MNAQATRRTEPWEHVDQASTTTTETPNPSHRFQLPTREQPPTPEHPNPVTVTVVDTIIEVPPPITYAQPTPTLPHTGVDTGILILCGVGLVWAGLMIWALSIFKDDRTNR